MKIGYSRLKVLKSKVKRLIYSITHYSEIKQNNIAQAELATREFPPSGLDETLIMAQKASRMGMSIDSLARLERQHGCVIAGSQGSPMVYDHSKDGPGSLVHAYSGSGGD